MKLGTYVSITLATQDPEQSMAFYEALDWQKISEDTLSDGSINLRLRKGDFSSPTLSYMGSDISAIRALFSPDKQKRKGTPATTAEFKDPNGLRITIDADESTNAMPAGTPTTRTPASRFGKFGEFSIPTKDLPKSMNFWTKLGFEALHMAKIPYPYAILSDGLIVLGLHQFDQPAIALAYFAEDMIDRIKQLKAAGLQIVDFPSDGSEDPNTTETENAMLSSPEGQAFYLNKEVL